MTETHEFVPDGNGLCRVTVTVSDGGCRGADVRRCGEPRSAPCHPPAQPAAPAAETADAAFCDCGDACNRDGSLCPVCADALRAELKAAQERAEREAEAFRILSRECERIDADRSSLRAELEAAQEEVAVLKRQMGDEHPDLTLMRERDAAVQRAATAEALLQATRDAIKFAANSPGGLVARIDATIDYAAVVASLEEKP